MEVIKRLCWGLLMCVVAATVIILSNEQSQPVKVEYEVAQVEVIEVEEPAQPTQPIVEEIVSYEPVKELWGNCRITAYCACEKCCGDWAKNRPVDPATGKQIVTGARGTQLISGYSVACSLPFGTVLEIDGFEGMQFEVEDRTAQWIQEKYDGMTVDIFIDSHEGCYEFMEGHSDWADVYIVREE